MTDGGGEGMAGHPHGEADDMCIHKTISIHFTLYRDFSQYFVTQPRRSMNVGYSWPGVFLLGASGRTGRFFTQLLFHNPHSI